MSAKPHPAGRRLLQGAGLIAAGTIIARTKNDGWLIAAGDELVGNATAAGRRFWSATR